MGVADSHPCGDPSGRSQGSDSLGCFCTVYRVFSPGLRPPKVLIITNIRPYSYKRGFFLNSIHCSKARLHAHQAGFDRYWLVYPCKNLHSDANSSTTTTVETRVAEWIRTCYSDAYIDAYPPGSGAIPTTPTSPSFPLN